MATYYELLIKGDDKAVSAYVGGIMHARGIKQGWYVSGQCPIQLKHIREMIKYHGNVQHIICTAALRATLVSAFKKAPAYHDFEVKEVRKIKGGRFVFEFETANRQVAGRIKRAVGRLPVGARLEAYAPKEKYDPSARGAEVYTPVHEYVFKGKGAIKGNIEAVINTHAKLSANEFIHCEDVEIVI